MFICVFIGGASFGINRNKYFYRNKTLLYLSNILIYVTTWNINTFYTFKNYIMEDIN